MLVAAVPATMLGTVEGFVDRLAELSPYARVDDAATAARVGQPLTDVPAFVGHVAERLGTGDPMVAASVAFLTVTNRAALPLALANEALGIHLAPAFDALRWREADGMVRLGFTDDRIGPAVSWRAWVVRFVDDIVVPWTELVAAGTRIGRRLLWGNAAASLIAAVEQVATSTGRSRSQTEALADEVLATMPFPDLVAIDASSGSLHARRRTCCLLFKAPGAGRCGDCSLDRRP